MKKLVLTTLLLTACGGQDRLAEETSALGGSRRPWERNIPDIADCPSPYQVASGRSCVYACADGTVPDTTTQTCVCDEGKIEKGFDRSGRRVCHHPFEALNPYFQSPRCVHCHALSTPTDFADVFASGAVVDTPVYGNNSQSDALTFFANLAQVHIDESRWFDPQVTFTLGSPALVDYLARVPLDHPDYDSAVPAANCSGCHNHFTGFDTRRGNGLTLASLNAADAVPRDDCHALPGESAQQTLERCGTDEWFAPRINFNWKDASARDTCEMVMTNMKVRPPTLAPTLGGKQPVQPTDISPAIAKLIQIGKLNHIAEHLSIDGRVIWSIRQLAPAGDAQFSSRTDPDKWLDRIEDYRAFLVENVDRPELWCP